MGNASKRFFGEVGYVTTESDGHGVFRPTPTERSYYGDVQTLSSRWQSTEHLNDDISVNHRISVIADPYALQNFPYIKYVRWLGTCWTVSTVEVEYPRLILSLGGVYNGPQV